MLENHCQLPTSADFQTTLLSVLRCHHYSDVVQCIFQLSVAHSDCSLVSIVVYVRHRTQLQQSCFVAYNNRVSRGHSQKFLSRGTKHNYAFLQHDWRTKLQQLGRGTNCIRTFSRFVKISRHCGCGPLDPLVIYAIVVSWYPIHRIRQSLTVSIISLLILIFINLQLLQSSAFTYFKSGLLKLLSDICFHVICCLPLFSTIHIPLCC